MKMKGLENKIIYIYGAIVLLLVLLLGNNNNIPDSFISRIIPPIHGDVWYININPLIIMILIFILLKRINQYKTIECIKNNTRRIIFLILVSTFLPTIWNPVIKIYKSFQNNLSSIYLYRNHMNLNLNVNKGEGEISGSIRLSNCSSTDQNFNVRIILPEKLRKEFGEDYIDIAEEFILSSKNELIINIDENIEIKNDSWGASFKINEFKLFNNENEVYFEAEFDRKLFDKLE